MSVVRVYSICVGVGVSLPLSTSVCGIWCIQLAHKALLNAHAHKYWALATNPSMYVAGSQGCINASRTPVGREKGVGGSTH